MQIAGQYFYAAAQGADYTGGSAMFIVGVSDSIKIFLSIPHWLTTSTIV